MPRQLTGSAAPHECHSSAHGFRYYFAVSACLVAIGMLYVL
ncbi:hypothetical protein [Cupriavidus sp. RAF12]